MSGSFDADDRHPPRGRYERSPGLSEVDTPVMSQQRALASILDTPPNAGNEGPFLPNFNAGEAETNGFSPQQRTPSSFTNQYDPLEPPAWEPPDTDEVEYTDAWNNNYNNQHHYLHPGGSQDDSTIGSSQTNSSFNNIAVAPNALRPRGVSLCSYADAGSVGSLPAPQPRGHGGHRRHPSLPVSFFSSKTMQGGSGLFQADNQNTTYQMNVNRQYLNSLQSNTYEIHSHHNASQVRADAAMAGLEGVLLDLYAVDRSVDSAAARMMAVKGDNTEPRAGDGGEKECTVRAERGSKSTKARKTTIGTLDDIKCILELHRVDKLVDRFKQDLQMPEFFEEEAWENTIWKDLRRTDVEMEEHARRKRASDFKENNEREALGRGKGRVECQFDLSDEELEGGDWNHNAHLGGEDIFRSAESLLSDHDPYQFFDPHEAEVLRANNSYQSSMVASSINDDLRDVIDLLRIDVEVDGASRRRDEMEMIKPLLDVDREVDRWKDRSEARDMWDEDIKALYLTDLEVDRAKRRHALEPKKAMEGGEAPSSGKDAMSDSDAPALPQSPSLPAQHPGPRADQEVKAMLSQHIPQISQPFCPTSPEPQASKASFEGPNLALPPPAPEPSPLMSTRPEAADENMAPANPSTAKRSIFSSQEKSSAANKCAFQRGVMVPGTTAIVAKGGEMIGDIPVGKVVATHSAAGAAIR